VANTFTEKSETSRKYPARSPRPLRHTNYLERRVASNAGLLKPLVVGQHSHENLASKQVNPSDSYLPPSHWEVPTNSSSADTSYSYLNTNDWALNTSNSSSNMSGKDLPLSDKSNIGSAGQSGDCDRHARENRRFSTQNMLQQRAINVG
jgi:hypothetical protein